MADDKHLPIVFSQMLYRSGLDGVWVFLHVQKVVSCQPMYCKGTWSRFDTFFVFVVKRAQ
jgi:hypothetical protein